MIEDDNEHDLEMWQRHEIYKNKRLLADKKFKVRNDVFLPKVGDTVLYSSFSKTGELILSGYGTVVKKTEQNKDRAQYYYCVRDIQTEKEVEVMSNSINYPNDFVEKIDLPSTEYFAGYDTLLKRIIPNTVATYQSDSEEQMQRCYGINWKETNPYYEVRKITIKVQ